MPHRKQGFSKLLRFSEILYLFLIFLSYYLLFLSRSGEARTVWGVLHPAFIPALFVATSFLVVISLSSEKMSYKLVFIIVHSVLVHSFFSIIFPAGDLSGQQMILGRIRGIYNNQIVHGFYPWTEETLSPFRVFQSFRGEYLQAAITVVLARMSKIDLLGIHLFLVPVLWGIFTPIAACLTTLTLTQNEKAAVLASVLISAFPYTIYFGAVSVPNSLGFIFFFYAVYFMLRNLNSNDSKTKFLMLAFCFFSFLSHSLTGIMSFSLLLLTLAFKSYKDEKSPPLASRFLLLPSFVLSASILPLSLIYLRLFRPLTYTVFTLDKLYESPFEESVRVFLLGELANGFDLGTILLVVLGPLLALSYMIYLLCKSKRNQTPRSRVQIYFLIAAFLIMLVDYRILKLFMDGVPFNEERLWVFRDFLAVPFVALATYGVLSSISTFLKTDYSSTVSFKGLKILSKSKIIRVLGLLFSVNVLMPVVLSGWITFSLSAAYPQVAPLQTTWYELEAVRFIEENTHEEYVVIGDLWTIYAGEVIVGINNPKAYYFAEFDKTGHDLLVNMTRDPSQKWMLLAMDLTNTKVAYFIVTEPRFGIEEFNSTVAKALQNGLKVYGPSGGFGNGKLYVFYYEE
jgi:hypothetical protein